MMLEKEIIKKIENSSLVEAIDTVAKLFPGQVVFSTSLGQEDQVI
ncbi:MAG: phosphoadenylyl-sulfate reductase, partial [Bacteroidia bacterium]|nr:phosphoadenylyl-sulfate reductase [Bacteroidia bacterium]